jgi:D-sedoheptulose 7-phosphate isomerase
MEAQGMLVGIERRVQDARLRLVRSTEVQRQVADTLADRIVAAADLIADAFAAEGKVLLCGNGGSAADCQHVAAEFVGQLRRDSERDPLPALSLVTDTSFLTAFANDRGFEFVFERQVRALARPGDILVAISTSGNSDNVLRAVETARDLKVVTIGLTGSTGRLAEIVDLAIPVPSADPQCIQEAHLAIEHTICELVERRVLGLEDGTKAGVRSR